MRHLVRVSCKIALFNQDCSKVLFAYYGNEIYGLHGGHIEKQESPNECMSRELFEETGISGVEMTRRDFWQHHNEKIILGYSGVISESTRLKPQYSEMVSLVWLSIEAIKNGQVDVRSYGDFVQRLAKII